MSDGVKERRVGWDPYQGQPKNAPGLLQEFDDFIGKSAFTWQVF
ncbi:hypothetical protein AAIM60_17020 [Pseudomonas lijiangensis]